MCVEVKEISIKDINALVIVHKRAFPDFFLTSLGDRFLSLYYKTVKKIIKEFFWGITEKRNCWVFALQRWYRLLSILAL